MVRLETGDTGVAVTADSDGALYSGMFGVDNYVVATGNKFKAEIQSNNKIKISDGSAIMNGRHIRVPAGDSELVTINNGSQGMNRIDLIVLRYKKELTGVESGSLVVIQGEETASEPKVPDHVKGDILTGATQADFPLYEVKLEGINITDITPLFQTIGNITELEKKFAELNGKSIIESGSNNNGYYRKYADGTLEMWGNIEIKFTFAGDKWGNDFYISRQRKITFPIPSLTEAIVNINAWNNSICFVNLSTLANNKTEFVVYMVKGSGADYDSLVCWHAFGTWK